MTLIPLTQASSRLGIDLKTLRRWLADAGLPLHADPQDARKKGVGAGTARTALGLAGTDHRP